MKKYVIVPFGLYDKVVDLNNEKNKLSDDGRMKCVIVKDSKHCLTGHRAYSSRLGTGLDYPYDAKVNNYSAISRIPVPLLWNLINRQRNNDRTEYKVKIKDLQGNEYTLNEYADELIVKHICGMIEDFENEQYSGGVERQILIPISNELTEYAQEYLIRAASAKGLKLTFVWKEIAALMQYLKENPLKCKLKKGSKGKVVYIGIESIESAFFELTEGDSGCLVPIRRRPVINRAQSTGLELLFIQLHDYFKDKCGYDENTASKLIWQVVNLRRDVFYRITGRDYENEPGILYTKNLIRVDQIDFENDFTGTILGDSPLYRT
ncbi:MAG: hypothetical protein ACI4M9_05160, partial [Succinivibrio sp.]